ncbi:MAG TPA: phytoene/squalene synthase family protein [Polyangia bacterium]|nr:phytoene/squalene synthase family protein [Polyangia bacterium]
MTAPTAGRGLARDILRRRARSFSWAARLLPPELRWDATALYAWCRRCDDAVDRAPCAASARGAVARLRGELDEVYGARELADPILAAFQEVVRRRALPRGPADELLDGMQMDLGRVRYATFTELLVYCHRVAGTVGLLMAHMMGVRDAATLGRAADLGVARQLTNLCRAVVEDEGRDRVYLPAELLGGAGSPRAGGAATARAVAELLRRADGYYRSADRGLRSLPPSCALAVRAARLLYAEIGAVLARRRFDVRRGRAVVSPARKAWLVLRAALEEAAARLRAAVAPGVRGRALP